MPGFLSPKVGWYRSIPALSLVHPSCFLLLFHWRNWRHYLMPHSFNMSSKVFHYPSWKRIELFLPIFKWLSSNINRQMWWWTYKQENCQESCWHYCASQSRAVFKKTATSFKHPAGSCKDLWTPVCLKSLENEGHIIKILFLREGD